MVELAQKVLYVLGSIPLLAAVLHALVRIVRRFHKFPTPSASRGPLTIPCGAGSSRHRQLR